MEISQAFAAGTGPLDFYRLLEPAARYASSFLAVNALLWIIHIAGYLGLVQVCHAAALGKGLPPLWNVLLEGLFLTIRRGFLAISLYIGLFFVVQMVMPPAILILLPGLMLPVLLVSGTRGVFRPIAHALKISYGERYPGGKWPLFFQLMSFGAFFYAGVLLSVFLSNQILDLDVLLSLPRGLWNTSIWGLPLSPMYVLSLLFKLTTLSFVISMMAAISVTFFIWVRRLPTHGIAV